MRPEAGVRPAVVALGRALRDNGVDVSVDEELVLCRALGEVDIRDSTGVYWAARSCLLRRRDDAIVFDVLFQRFWAGLPLGPSRPVAEHGESDPRMAPQQHGGASLPQHRPDGRKARPIDGDAARAGRGLELETAPADEPGSGAARGTLAAYSPAEVLRDADDLRYEKDELAAVRRLADELRMHLPLRLSRRARPGRRCSRLDLRRTLRSSHATDGELLRLVHSGPSRRPRRLLLLCDVSGSMERYSRSLLLSLRAVVGAASRAEAFVFATRLTRVTEPLGCHDVERALARAHEAAADWSGGTRIGRALHELRTTYARLGLTRGAVVIVVSDGWDRGDLELLASELAVLRLQARRLVWVTPRASDLGGQPLANGLRAALPFVDDVVSGRDAPSIAALVRRIGRLGDHRAPRPRSAIRSSLP